MALALAMALVGLNPEEFCGLLARLSADYRKLPGVYDYPSSPSPRSDSSGFGSRASSVRSSDGNSPWITPNSSRTPSVRSTDGNTPLPTPTSSRPNTPLDEITKHETRIPLPIIPKKRDLLDLGGHLKNSPWTIVHPSLPLNDFKRYLGNKSVYYRVMNKGLLEDYPTRRCDDCNFTEPSPLLLREENDEPWSLTMVGFKRPSVRATLTKQQQEDNALRKIFEGWQPVSTEHVKHTKMKNFENPKKFSTSKQGR